MRDYKNIKTYQLADKMVMEIYRVTRNFPKDELYGITSQLRRAAVSVTTNIVEGASRQHKKDYLNFLYIARGSMAECEYLLDLANRLGYLSELRFNDTIKYTLETSKALYGLIRAVTEEII